MGFPPTDKTFEGLLRDNRERLDLLERRLAAGVSAANTSKTPPGLLAPFAGSAIPSGWLLCDGRAVSRTTYAALFAAIGGAWGAGDGSTTFNLPNFKGRTAVGRDTAQAEFDVVGEVGGEKTHTLTTVEMPAHQHIDGWAGVNASAAYGVAPSAPVGNINTQNGQSTTNHAYTSSTGLGGAHNNLQPYAVVNWIIAAYSS